MGRPSWILGLTLLTAVAASGASRDGRDFDPGATMTARAAGAPEELDRVAPLRGRWAVEQRVPRHRQTGYSWFSETSTDRGASFSTTWTIRAERAEEASATAAEPPAAAAPPGAL